MLRGKKHTGRNKVKCKVWPQLQHEMTCGYPSPDNNGCFSIPPLLFPLLPYFELNRLTPHTLTCISLFHTIVHPLFTWPVLLACLHSSSLPPPPPPPIPFVSHPSNHCLYRIYHSHDAKRMHAVHTSRFVSAAERVWEGGIGEVTTGLGIAAGS